MNGVIRYSVFVLLWLFTLTATAFAQSPLSVTVSDSDGRAVPAARVVVLVDGREIASAATNDKGEVSFASAPVANYQISVSKAGFETARRQAARAVGNDAQVVGVTLAPATQHESV